MRAIRDIQQAVRTADVTRTQELLRLRPELARVDGLLHLAVSIPRASGSICPTRVSLCTANRLTIVKLLLTHGADLDARDFAGDTPLLRAVTQGSGELAELLLERGANPNVVNRCGETPLHRAVQKRRLALVPLLLSFEAVMEVKDRKGLTPFQVAHDDDMEAISDFFSRYEGAQRYINSFSEAMFGAGEIYSPDVRAGVRFVPTLVTTGAFAL